jgi:hypothetical protein
VDTALGIGFLLEMECGGVREAQYKARTGRRARVAQTVFSDCPP